MKNKGSLYYFIILIWFAGKGVFAQSERNGSLPNVILIYTDDQKRDEFNFLPEGQENGVGRNLSPHMDYLCRDGMVFTHFYVSAPVCTPSRYNLLTGNYASRAATAKEGEDGMIRLGWNVSIKEETPHIASYLKDAGYYTGFIGKNHTYNIRGKEFVKGLDFTDRQPDDPEVLDSLKKMQNAMAEDLRNVFDYDFAGYLYKGNITTGTYPASLGYHNLEWLVKGAYDFLDSAKVSEKPFFLHFATTLTHSPFEDGTAYTGDVRATPVGLSDDHLGIMPSRESIIERVISAGKDSSQADITWIDDGIGAILDKLEEIGELDNTIIFYFNDNGPVPGKSSLYEVGARTFGFIWGYGQKGAICDQYISNIDIMPTVLELAQVPKNSWPSMDGVSLVDLLNNPSLTMHESIYLEIGFTRAVVKDGYKYLAFRLPEEVKNAENQAYHLGRPNKIMNLELWAEEAHPHYFDQNQLYDIRESVADTINLYDDIDKQDLVEDLKTELRKHLCVVPGLFQELKPEECDVSNKHAVQAFSPQVIHQGSYLYINSLKQVSRVQLFDLQGRILLDDITNCVHVGAFKHSVYIIQVFSDGQVYTKKIVL
ncbi:hypothetical protein E9993_05865 [Labilibacter sediminis]|nr:hypothetical protein E9993_05865 [Labilibacter sediminis]